MIAALNKIDALTDKRAMLPRIAEIAALHEFAAIVPISAERGSELPALEACDRRPAAEGPGAVSATTR